MKIPYRAGSCRRWPLLLPIALAAAGCFFPAPARAAVVYRGDLNRDGKVTLADAIVAVQMAAKVIPVGPGDLLAGDVSPMPGTDGRDMGDGKITTADAIRILQYVVGLISATEFFGGKSAAIETSHPMLSLAIDGLQKSLYSGRPGVESDVSVVISGADRIAIGSVTLAIAPINGGPPLSIVRVERGSALSPTATIETTPSPLLAAGADTVRSGFSLGDADLFSGSGDLLKFVVKSTGVVPRNARYRIALSYPDFSSDEATAIPLEPVEAILAAIP